MTSYLNTINSEGVDLNLNSTSIYPVVIGNGLTSLGGTRTFGASTIGVITGSSATFSSTVTTTGLLTASGGITSTASATILGASTIGAITGTSASFSSTVGVSGLLTTSGGLTSTAGATTLGASTIGEITGTSATFSGLLTASGGLTSTAGATTLGASTIGAITGTSATFSGLLTASGGLTSTAGATTLGTSTIGAITGTSATFSSTLGVTGLFTGTSGTFSTSLGVTGLITANGGITSTSSTNNFGATTMSSQLAMGNNKITGLATPTLTTDAATKGYVDSAIQGIDTKMACHVATTGPLTLATDFEDGDTIDGHVINTGQRVLIKNQTNGIENGIYIVNSTGSPTRSTDLDTGSSAAGVFTFIEKGTVNADIGYICSSNSGSDVVGTDSLTFVQFSSAGVVEAGTGLTKTGNILSVNASQTQITSVGSLTSLSTGTITGTSATFSSTLGVTSSATFSSTVGVSGLLTASNGFTSTLGSTSLGATTIGAITGTSATFSTTVGITDILSANGGITSSLSSASTSNSTGALRLVGGIGINNTTDATDVTNGGTITTAGGLAVAKKVFVGSSLDVANTTSSSGFLARGSTDGTVSILPQASAGTYNFNLPTTSGLLGQVLSSSGGGASPMQWVTPAVTTGAPQTFTASGNQNQTNADVTGLLYSAPGSFDINMTVSISSLNPTIRQLFRLSAVSVHGGWSMTVISLTGDDTLVDFSITAGGQVQYTSSSYFGFGAMVFTWVTFSATQGMSYLSLAGTSSGNIVVAPQPNSGTYNYNLPISAGTSGQVLTSQGGGATAMSWTNIKRTFIEPGSFSGVGNQVAPSNVTGLLFASGYFELEVIVTVIATTSLTQFFKLSGVFNSTSSVWFLTSTPVVGNTTSVVFTINSSGQILYTSTSYTGFTSLTITWN